MNTARALLSNALTSALPQDVRVLDYARNIDGVGGSVFGAGRLVMVRLDSVVPSPMPQAWHRYSFSIIAVVGKTEPGPADDELDLLLTDVLLALEAADLPAWTAAQRAVLDDAFPCYEVALTLDVTKE